MAAQAAATKAQKTAAIKEKKVAHQNAQQQLADRQVETQRQVTAEKRDRVRRVSDMTETTEVDDDTGPSEASNASPQKIPSRARNITEMRALANEVAATATKTGGKQKVSWFTVYKD